MTITLKENSHTTCPPSEKIKDYAQIRITPVDNYKVPDYHGNKYFQIYQSFFNFGYYLGIAPYRFSTETLVTGRRVVLKSSMLRKGLALFSWIACIIFHGINQRNRILVASLHSHVLTYFNVVHALMHGATNSLLFLELFFKKDAFMNMMKTLHDCNLLEEKDRKKQRKSHYCILIFHCIFLVLIPFVGLLEPLEMNYWSIENTLKWNIYTGKRYLFIYEYPNHNDSATLYEKFENLSKAEIILGALPFGTWFCYSFVQGLRLVSFCQAGWTIYGGAKLFLADAEKIFEDQSVVAHERKETLLHKYRELKKLSDALNDVWAVSFFFVIVDHTLWLATDLNSGLMKEEAISKKLVVCWYFTGVIILLTYAAEAVRKMTKFKVLLVERGHEIFESQQELQNFLASLEVNGVCMGKHGVYQFNYNFIGQVLGLVITFFIVTLQSELTK